MSLQNFKNSLKQKLNLTKDIEKTSSIVTTDSGQQKSSSENQDLKEILKNSQAEKSVLIKKIANLENAQDIIFEQFRELELQRVDIEKHQKTLEETSKKFRIRTIELFGKMTDLKKAKKTISLQNDELEKQREQLRELNASKDKFFSIIAHDLRNPIAGFLNLTDVLSTNFDIFSESENKDFITVINQASKQLYNLLENLLQWSRSQTGSINYEPKYISIKKMINETIDALMINIENKQLKINIKVDDKTIAYVDENMITTVIRNLISNAIKFSPPKESINVRCTQQDEFIVLSVTDNGVGIKKEDQNKLFRIDKHITTPGTANEQGSGLGLILCNEFVEKNGGKIWVESEINKGSSFIFTIPRKAIG